MGKFAVIHGETTCSIPLLGWVRRNGIGPSLVVYPEPFVEVYKAFKRETSARDEVPGHRGQTCGRSSGGHNMAYFQRSPQKARIDVGHMRKPQLDLTATEKSHLGKELEQIEQEFLAPVAGRSREPSPFNSMVRRARMESVPGHRSRAQASGSMILRTLIETEPTPAKRGGGRLEEVTEMQQRQLGSQGLRVSRRLGAWDVRF